MFQGKQLFQSCVRKTEREINWDRDGVRCKSMEGASGSYFVVMEAVLCLDRGSGYTNLYLG